MKKFHLDQEPWNIKILCSSKGKKKQVLTLETLFQNERKLSINRKINKKGRIQTLKF